jgi:hypothetical membrane protein
MMVKNVLIFQDSRIVHHLGKYKKDFLIQYLLVVIFHENTRSLVVLTFLQFVLKFPRFIVIKDHRVFTSEVQGSAQHMVY